MDEDRSMQLAVAPAPHLAFPNGVPPSGVSSVLLLPLPKFKQPPPTTVCDLPRFVKPPAVLGPKDESAVRAAKKSLALLPVSSERQQEAEGEASQGRSLEGSGSEKSIDLNGYAKPIGERQASQNSFGSPAEGVSSGRGRRKRYNAEWATRAAAADGDGRREQSEEREEEDVGGNARLVKRKARRKEAGQEWDLEEALWFAQGWREESRNLRSSDSGPKDVQKRLKSRFLPDWMGSGNSPGGVRYSRSAQWCQTKKQEVTEMVLRIKAWNSGSHLLEDELWKLPEAETDFPKFFSREFYQVVSEAVRAEEAALLTTSPQQEHSRETSDAALPSAGARDAECRSLFRGEGQRIVLGSERSGAFAGWDRNRQLASARETKEEPRQLAEQSLSFIHEQHVQFPQSELKNASAPGVEPGREGVLPAVESEVAAQSPAIEQIVLKSAEMIARIMDQRSNSEISRHMECMGVAVRKVEAKERFEAGRWARHQEEMELRRAKLEIRKQELALREQSLELKKKSVEQRERELHLLEGIRLSLDSAVSLLKGLAPQSHEK